MRSILEKALIALLNEEKDKADALFHDFILERSRQIHESLRQGEDFVLDESWEQELAIDEMFTAEDLDGSDDEAPQVGDSIDHKDLGTVEVMEVTERDVYGEPAQYLVRLEDNSTQEVSYDYLVGDIAQDYLGEAEEQEEDGDEGEDDSADAEEGDDAAETDDEGDTSDSDEADVDSDAEAEEGEGDDLSSDVENLEHEVEDIKDELARLAAEFDALMDNEDGDKSADSEEDEGDDATKKEVEEGALEFSHDDDGSLELRHEVDDDEDFDKLGESIIDALEKVNGGKNSEGLTTGDKQTVDTKSRALVTSPDARQAGKPVKVKSVDHAGFDRETAPKVDTMKQRKNTFKRAIDSKSPVMPNGHKEAILNTLGDDKTSQKGIFDKKRV